MFRASHPLSHRSGRQPKTYVKPEAAITVLSSWWRAVCRPKHVEQLRNTGIINSNTRSHLVGSFYEIYIAMHGSMNIKNIKSPEYFVEFCRRTRRHMSKHRKQHTKMEDTPSTFVKTLFCFKSRDIWNTVFFICVRCYINHTVHCSHKKHPQKLYYITRKTLNLSV